MRKLILILMAIACLSMTGCGSRRLMQHADPATMNTSVSLNEAAIVFYRDLDFSLTAKDLIPIVGPFLSTKVAPILEISEDEQVIHIAYLIPGQKYLHRTTPGKHVYVVGSYPSEILDANMDIGKTYYVGVDQISGLTPSFAFDLVVDPANDLPSNFNSENWLAWTENTPRGKHWFEKNKQKLHLLALTEYKKSKEVNSEDNKVILPEYGTITPIR